MIAALHRRTFKLMGTETRYRRQVLAAIAICAGALIAACVSSAPRHPAPVVTPKPLPREPVVKAYPVESLPDLQGEELQGVALPAAGEEPPMLLGSLDNGTPLHLSQYLGNVVVVMYWTSSCVPCQTQLSQLEQIRADYAGRGARIVAVNKGESRADINAFLSRQSRPLRLVIASDRSGSASISQGVTVVPTTLVFDPSGKISKRYVGLFGFNAQRIRGDIERLLSRRG